MQNELAIVLVSDFATFLLSMLVSLFVAGVGFGQLRRDVTQLKQDVAEIKGMFITRIRGDRIDKD